MRFRSGQYRPASYRFLKSSAADAARFLFYILGRVKGSCFSSLVWQFPPLRGQCIMAEQVKARFGLGDLSVHVNVPRNHLLIVLKSYFDGGNKADSREYRIVTLAALAGTEKAWR